jgi:hypothetical protein
MDLIPHATVESFFHEAVTEAMESRSVSASEHTEFYLVGLLGEFARGRITDAPLSVKLVESQTSSPEERIRTLKQVGDTSLYVTGFFAESLGRRLVDPDYYIGIGEAAYRELAASLGASAAIQEVYEELSDKFPRFVDVLHEVRSKVSFSGTDVAELYDEWKRTRSEWLGRRLRALGLILPDEDARH